MNDPVETALALWGLSGARHHFVAGRENRIYRVETGQTTLALRFKRPGYRRIAELRSELQWMAEMARAGLMVPTPMPSLSGALIETCKGQHVDVLSWLTGRPLGASGAPLNLPDAPATFRALGCELAKLHMACDAWTLPKGFDRCRWDAEGLLGDTPLWGRFWDNPTLDAKTRDLMHDFRKAARRDLAGCKDWDFGLIHADPVRENLLIDGDTIRLIDFDDGGFGFRLFDIATALLKNRSEPDFDALKTALIDGYRNTRPLDVTHLDLFLALRAVTYVGWIVPRMHENGSPARNTRFINDAQELCSRYLERA